MARGGTIAHSILPSHEASTRTCRIANRRYLSLRDLFVDIRPGELLRASRVLLKTAFSRDKTIKAVRIEAAIFDDNGIVLKRERDQHHRLLESSDADRPEEARSLKYDAQ